MQHKLSFLFLMLLSALPQASLAAPSPFQSLHCPASLCLKDLGLQLSATTAVIALPAQPTAITAIALTSASFPARYALLMVSTWTIILVLSGIQAQREAKPHAPPAPAEPSASASQPAGATTQQTTELAAKASLATCVAMEVCPGVTILTALQQRAIHQASPHQASPNQALLNQEVIRQEANYIAAFNAQTATEIAAFHAQAVTELVSLNQTTTELAATGLLALNQTILTQTVLNQAALNQAALNQAVGTQVVLNNLATLTTQTAAELASPGQVTINLANLNAQTVLNQAVGVQVASVQAIVTNLTALTDHIIALTHYHMALPTPGLSSQVAVTNAVTPPVQAATDQAEAPIAQANSHPHWAFRPSHGNEQAFTTSSYRSLQPIPAPDTRLAASTASSGSGMGTLLFTVAHILYFIGWKILR